MINHQDIKLTLNKKFDPVSDTGNFNHIFYTGPIDAFFSFQFGRLGYRTVTFEKKYSTGDHQGASQVNYCDETIPFTRVTEHKHFTPWEKYDKTIYFTEFSKETGINDVPFYPKRLATDKERLKQYRSLAENQQAVSFLGRLATYRYMDMHHVIDEAMFMAKQFINSLDQQEKPPVFPNIELI